MKKNKEKYGDIKQAQIKEQQINKRIADGNADFYTDEDIYNAQNRTASKKINDIYYQIIFPASYSLIYIFFCALSLIMLPLQYIHKNDNYFRFPFIIGYFSLIVIFVVSLIVDKKIKRDIQAKHSWIEYTVKFSNDTSLFTYFLTSLGYMSSALSLWEFGLMYISMLFVIGIDIYSIIKKIIQKKKAHVE